MRTGESESQFDEAVLDASGVGSWYEAMSVIKNQIGWLEYVAEEELSDEERKRVVVAARKFFAVLRPLTEKYID